MLAIIIVLVVGYLGYKVWVEKVADHVEGRIRQNEENRKNDDQK